MPGSGHIFGSRFWRLQSPLFLHERTSLVRVRRSSQSDRVRRSSQSEGGRRKAQAIPIMFWTIATGFAESSTHPPICCLTGCLICLTGKSVDLVGDWPVQPLFQKYFCFSEIQI